MAKIEKGIRLIDSHCHLDFKDFENDLPHVLARAGAAGVFRVLTISTSLRELAKLISIAESYPAIFCTAGVHPHNAQNEGVNDPQKIVNQLEHKKIIGIGESGLDFHYDFSDIDCQRKNFICHIEASRTTGLPLIIHSRAADDEMCAILQNEQKKGEFSFILHCFTGGQKLADIAIELGGFISVSGIITFKNASDLRSVIKTVPIERLLIETDAPYLSPVPFRGARNEPANLIYTFDELLKIKECSQEELAFHTTDNFLKLFTKMPKSDTSIEKN